MIVFADPIRYPDNMTHSIQIDSSTTRTGTARRALLIALAFVYLFVGVAHQMSCFDQAVASGFVSDKASHASHDGGTSPPDFASCDHCPTCVPAVMPAPMMEAAPCGLPSSPPMSVASLIAADHAWLDKPPPKSLT